MRTASHIRRLVCSASAVLSFCLMAPTSLAADTQTQIGSDPLAFEAEDIGDIVNGSPTTWTNIADAGASGGRALFAGGASDNDNPASTVSYSLQFAAPGTYSLTYHWRSDPALTGGDAFLANSFRLPTDWGLAPTDISDSNNLSAPASNSYSATTESLTYTVTQPQIDAGPLTFTIGTREAGTHIDRFIFALVPEPAFLTPLLLLAGWMLHRRPRIE